MNTMAGYANEYDPRIQAAIKTVKIPYCVGGGNTTIMSGANGLSCKIFMLFGREVGFTNNESSYFPNDGSKLDYFISGNTSSAQQRRVANLNGRATRWWLRSPDARNTYDVWDVHSSGDYSQWPAVGDHGLRSTFLLPSTFVFLESEVVQ